MPEWLNGAVLKTARPVRVSGVQIPLSPQYFFIQLFMKLSFLEIILVVSTLLELNPLFQAVKAVKTKSVKDISILTFLSILAIGALWLIYGITIKNIPLIIGNVIKLLTALCVVVIYFRYKNRE